MYPIRSFHSWGDSTTLLSRRGYLREGGQGYDIMDWSAEQVIEDVIEQYEKHMHFLSNVR